MRRLFSNAEIGKINEIDSMVKRRAAEAGVSVRASGQQRTLSIGSLLLEQTLGGSSATLAGFPPEGKIGDISATVEGLKKNHPAGTHKHFGMRVSPHGVLLNTTKVYLGEDGPTRYNYWALALQPGDRYQLDVSSVTEFTTYHEGDINHTGGDHTFYSIYSPEFFANSHNIIANQLQPVLDANRVKR